MKLRAWHMTSALIVDLALTALAVSSVRAQEDGLPDGPGKQDLVDSCTACHDTGPITAQKHTADEWTDIVIRMQGLGASLSDQQSQAVVAYLAANYGPSGPPAAAPAAPAAAAPAAPAN